MTQKILLDTAIYLAKKQNPDDEDLKNEKSAWSQLVAMGIREEKEIPERAKEKELSKSRSRSKDESNTKDKEIKSATKTKRTTEKAANPQ